MATPRQLAARLEARIARDIGGRVLPASGSRWGARRDIRSPHWLVEAKSTSLGYHRVIANDLKFLQRQAYQLGLTPAYVVEFQPDELIALIPNDVTPDQAPVLLDRIEHDGWSLIPQEVILLRCPCVVRFACGCYTAIPYERFLDIVRTFVA